MILEAIDRLRHVARSRAWTPDRALGRRGEDLAHRFLRRRGFTIVARNWRAASGTAEVDLIAWDGDELVLVEVKSRESGDFGPPERAIDADKQRHLIRAAREYSRRASVDWQKVRFDVVTVIFSRPPALEHYRRAIPTL